jgi:hypothetical protein
VKLVLTAGDLQTCELVRCQAESWFLTVDGPTDVNQGPVMIQTRSAGGERECTSHAGYYSDHCQALTCPGLLGLGVAVIMFASRGRSRDSDPNFRNLQPGRLVRVTSLIMTVNGPDPCPASADRGHREWQQPVSF